jgi:peptidoglycan/LPS O-acetylase OafA/YrhL
LVSYSLYLWHYPMLSAARGLGWLDGARAAPWIVVLFAVVPLILIASWLSYRFVERPFLRPDKPSRVPAAPTRASSGVIAD